MTRKNPWLIVTLAAFAALFPLLSGGSKAAVGGMLTGHSHWDDPNGDYEIQICYDVLGNSDGFTSEIAHIPFREQDAPNFYDLVITTSGFKLTRRINNVPTEVKPTFQTPHTFGVGSGIMFDLVAQGSTFTLYQLLGTPTNPIRGPEWYQWHDSTYSRGVNVSYYTVAHWDGKWDNVTATPLDGFGVGHKIHGLEQDARNVPGSGATFDSPTPAEGSVTGASTAKNGSQATYGLASGSKYTYTLTVDKAGTGHFDFRDPASSSDGTGSYFASSFYRLTLGTTPQIQRFNGSSASTVYKAPAGSGGAGTYGLQLDGGKITLENAAGTSLISFDDGGPQSGIRVRLVFGDQVWSWTGKIGVSGSTTSPPTPTTTTAATTTTPTPTTTTTTTTPTPAGTTTLTASADAYLDASSASTNRGTSSSLYVDASPVKRSLIRFDLSTLSGTVVSAKLRVHAASAQSTGYQVQPVASGWDEKTVDDANAPQFGPAVGSSGPVQSGQWTEVSIPPSMITGGELDIGLATSDSTNLHLDSRESSDPPQLVITTGS
jgi:hypothetical protein